MGGQMGMPPQMGGQPPQMGGQPGVDPMGGQLGMPPQMGGQQMGGQPGVDQMGGQMGMPPQMGGQQMGGPQTGMPAQMSGQQMGSSMQAQDPGAPPSSSDPFSSVAEAPWSVAEWAVALRFDNPRAAVLVLLLGCHRLYEFWGSKRHKQS